MPPLPRSSKQLPEDSPHEPPDDPSLDALRDFAFLRGVYVAEEPCHAVEEAAERVDTHGALTAVRASAGTERPSRCSARRRRRRRASLPPRTASGLRRQHLSARRRSACRLLSRG